MILLEYDVYIYIYIYIVYYVLDLRSPGSLLGCRWLRTNEVSTNEAAAKK